MTARIAIATAHLPADIDIEDPLVAAELRRRGYAVDVVAWDRKLDWPAYDLVVVRSTWDYFDRVEQFLVWADDVGSVTRIVNPPNVIRWNSHKGYLTELGAAGIPVLPALEIPAGTHDAADRVASTQWHDLVVKPAVDGGARFAHRGLASSPDTQAHALSLARTGDVIVQPYAVGIEAGEISLFFFGGAYSHAVRKVPKPGDYRVQALHGGSEVPHVPTSAELEVAAAAMVQVPGRLTYARVDLLDHEGRPTLMELELIEPDLFLRVDGGALDRFCDAVEAELSSVTG